MSTYDTRKLASIIRSIELLESKLNQINFHEFIHFSILDKTNIIHSDYTTSNNDIDHIPIDDTN